MIKYKLTIEGTKEEIEKLKEDRYTIKISAHAPYSFPTYVSIIPDFVEKAPSCRYKTLKELVLEFGDRVEIIDNPTHGARINIRSGSLDWGIECRYLGQPVINDTLNVGPLVKEDDLAEIHKQSHLLGGKPC